MHATEYSTALTEGRILCALGKTHLPDTLSNKKAKGKTVRVYDTIRLYKTKINPQKCIFNTAILYVHTIHFPIFL